jgi:hypothetical protein
MFRFLINGHNSAASIACKERRIIHFVALGEKMLYPFKFPQQETGKLKGNLRELESSIRAEDIV